jgi:hypothetical protein
MRATVAFVARGLFVAHDCAAHGLTCMTLGNEMAAQPGTLWATRGGGGSVKRCPPFSRGLTRPHKQAHAQKHIPNCWTTTTEEVLGHIITSQQVEVAWGTQVAARRIVEGNPALTGDNRALTGDNPAC